MPLTAQQRIMPAVIESGQEPRLRIETGMHTSSIWAASTDASGKLVLTTSGDQTARLWLLNQPHSHSQDAQASSSVPAVLLRVFRPPLTLNGRWQSTVAMNSLSPDGKTALVGGWGTELKQGDGVFLFDTSSGDIVNSIHVTSGYLKDAAFSPGGTHMAFACGGSQPGLHITTIAGQLVAKDNAYSGDCNCADWFGNQRLITGSEDGVVRLYSFEAGNSNQPGSDTGKASGGSSLKLLALNRIEGMPAITSAKFSPDGTKVALCFKGSQTVAILDGATLSLSRTLSQPGNVRGSFSSVAWLQDKGVSSLVAAGTWPVNSGTRLAVWRFGQTMSAESFAAIPGDVLSLFTSDSRKLLMSGVLPAWGIASWHDDTSISPKTKLVTSLAGVSPVADFRGSRFSFKSSEDASIVGFQYTYDFNNPVPFEPQAMFSLRDRTLTKTPDTTVLRELKGPRLRGLDVAQWRKELVSKDKQTAIARNVPEHAFSEGGKVTLNGAELPISEHESTLSMAIAPGNDYFVLGTDWRLHCFDSAGHERWNLSSKSPVHAVTIVQNGSMIVAALGDGTIRWYRSDTGREVLACFPHADRRRWVIWTNIYRRVPTGRAIVDCTLDWAGKKLVVASVTQNSAAYLAGLRQGDVVTKLDKINSANRYIPGAVVSLTVQRGDRRLLISWRAGVEFGDKIIGSYYDCSEGGEDLIGWHVDRGPDQAADFFPCSQFRDRFYRPDVIDEMLSTWDSGKAEMLANNKRPGHVEAETTDIAKILSEEAPPVVEILGNNPQGVPVDRPEFELRYRVRRPEGRGLRSIRVMVNGESRPGIRPPIPGNSDETSVVKVPIPSEDCNVTVFAEGDYGRTSEGVVVRVLWKGAPTEVPSNEADSLKPRCYVLALGCGKYDNLPSLSATTNDAQAFVDAWKKQEGKRYGKVETKLLKDSDNEEQQPLKSNLELGLDWLMHAPVRPGKDLVVLFLAGHAELDGNNKYRFALKNYAATHSLSSSLDVDDLTNALSSISATVLVFLDTCHADGAGNILARGVNYYSASSTASQKIAQKSNGRVIVFSACKRGQFSYEDKTVGHGFFTLSILEALGARARESQLPSADADNSGELTIGELEDYLIKRVPELCNRQDPVRLGSREWDQLPIASLR